jgi:hypothetical protein
MHGNGGTYRSDNMQAYAIAAAREAARVEQERLTEQKRIERALIKERHDNIMKEKTGISAKQAFDQIQRALKGEEDINKLLILDNGDMESMFHYIIRIHELINVFKDNNNDYLKSLLESVTGINVNNVDLFHLRTLKSTYHHYLNNLFEKGIDVNSGYHQKTGGICTPLALASAYNDREIINKLLINIKIWN